MTDFDIEKQERTVIYSMDEQWICKSVNMKTVSSTMWQVNEFLAHGYSL